MSARAAWRLESLGFKQVYRYTAGKMDWLASGLPVEGQFADEPCAGDIAHRDVPTCRLDERLSEARRRADGWPVCVVVNEQKVVLGLLRIQAMQQADGQQSVEQVMESGPRTYRPYVHPERLMRYFDKYQERYGVLLTTADGNLIGFVRREDVEGAMQQPQPEPQHA